MSTTWAVRRRYSSLGAGIRNTAWNATQVAVQQNDYAVHL